MHNGFLFAALALAVALAHSACRKYATDSVDQVSNEATAPPDGDEPLPDCEWCGADEAPDELDWKTRIASEDEPGEPLIISGAVYQPDGRTPAPGVILYVYHTNAEGIYPRRGDETGNGRRHGYLRAWLQTDHKGRYQFTTIRPASYPSRTDPAHIHVTIKEPERDEYWIDSFMFRGDPLITERILDRQTGRGGPGIIELVKDENGVWRGTRDIILKR